MFGINRDLVQFSTPIPDVFRSDALSQYFSLFTLNEISRRVLSFGKFPPWGAFYDFLTSARPTVT